MTFKVSISKLNLGFLIVAFLVNIPFVVLASMWAWEQTHNGMAIAGPVGAWLTLFVGMLWGCRSQINNLLGSIRDRDELMNKMAEENQRLVNIINKKDK